MARKTWFLSSVATRSTPQEWPRACNSTAIDHASSNARIDPEAATKDGPTNHDVTTFFISSHAPRVRTLARHIRGHWGIENRQHWVLDVTFAEDASRIRTGSSPEIAAAFRRLALNILQRDTSLIENIRGKRLHCRLGRDRAQRNLRRIFCT